MPRVECPTCHGRYDDVDPKGVPYRHVCPPLSTVELTAALNAGVVVLSKADGQRLRAAQIADDTAPVKPDEATHTERVLGALVVLRPGHRDENEPDTPPALALVPIDEGLDDPAIPL